MSSGNWVNYKSRRYGSLVGPIKHADWGEELPEEQFIEEEQITVTAVPEEAAEDPVLEAAAEPLPAVSEPLPVILQETVQPQAVAAVKPLKRTRDPWTVILPLLALTALLALAGYLGFREYSKVVKEVTIETGSEIKLSDFLKEHSGIASFYSDISKIDTNVPESYALTLNLWKFKTDVILNVRDTTPPTGKAVPCSIYAGQLPDVHSLVTDLEDRSGTVMVAYEGEPDVSAGGSYNIPVTLTDLYGNKSTVEVPFTVIDDKTPPVITGVHPIKMFTGDTFVIMNGVLTEDDHDPAPDLSVDISKVRAGTPGVYDITYTAVDEVGNTASESTTITIEERPENFYDEDLVYSMASVIYDEIVPDKSISDAEKVYRIFRWTYDNVTYVDTSPKAHWTEGAYDGFSNLRGDCYNSYSCAKALLDVAGIENMYISGSDEKKDKFHCWNLVKIDGKWYHCDACKSRIRDDLLFMGTDKDADPRFPFDGKAYPKRAKKAPAIKGIMEGKKT